MQMMGRGFIRGGFLYCRSLLLVLLSLVACQSSSFPLLVISFMPLSAYGVLLFLLLCSVPGRVITITI